MTQSHDQRRQEASLVPREGRDPEGVSGPLVTVVIPCYNQAHFLSEAIESALSQTYPNFEVIVVDDGSTDETSEVARRYAQRVRLIRQENRGLSGARNTGIRHARGEYVVFLDADDRLLPEALEPGVEQLEAHPECAFSSGRCDHVAVDGTPLPHTPRLHVEGDPYLALLRRCYIWPPAVVVYRRAVFEAVGGFNTSVNPSADYEMYLRVARRYPVCHHTEVVAQYRHHDENMSGDRARMLKYSIGVLRSQREHIKGRKLYEEAYRAGLRWERGRFGDPLVAEVKAQLKEGEWVRALQGVVALVRYHPQGAALLVLNERRMKRRILARRLQARKQELEPVERRLKELEEGSTRPEEKGWEDAVAEERQKAQRLREGIQRLERRIRNLEDRRARKGRSGKVRRLFERLRRAREKASRR